MSMNLSIKAKNVACATLTALIDEGSELPGGYIEIRTGVKPMSPENTATGLVLAICNLSNPSFGVPVDGIATANPIAIEDKVLNDGTAKWFRVYNRDQESVFDGDISPIGLEGDITFDNVIFIKDGVVTIAQLLAIIP